jgi:hypothetical protein
MSTPSSRTFTLFLLGLSSLCGLATAFIYWKIYGPARMFGDFGVFYATARHAASEELSAVYDVALLRQQAASGSIKGLSFFLNPPTALLLLYPLGFLSGKAALASWTVLQIALLALVLRTPYIKRNFAGEPGGVNTMALLGITFFAFSLQNILYGQAALLCSCFFLLVIILRRTHPVLAGIALGLFSFKPQLGLLLPLLLLAEGNVKAILAALITTLAMIALSVAAFGGTLWQEYHETLLILGRFMAKNQSALLSITISFYGSLRNLGFSPALSGFCQCLLSALVALGLWPVLRKGGEAYKILMLSLAAYLVTPYALLYDTPLLAIACAFFLRRVESAKGARLELIAPLLLILMPLATFLLQLSHVPYAILSIGLAFLAAGRLAKRDLILRG